MPTKKPVAKKTTAPKEQTPADLQTSLMAKKADLLELQRGLAAGELANPRIVSTTRKDIARLKTALRAAELAGKGEK